MRKSYRRILLVLPLVALLLFTGCTVDIPVTVTATALTGGSASVVTKDGSETVESNETVIFQAVADEGYTFSGWYLDDVLVTDENPHEVTVLRDYALEARFTRTIISLTIDYGDVEPWASKSSLYEAFFGAFYEFIRERDPDLLSSHNASDKASFLSLCQDWDAEGQNSLYGMGNAFCQYYVMETLSQDIAEQDTDHFIGWCYQNGKFKPFINFLISFFAYWRNDEGYTTFSPYNHGDRFFYDSWAALVDTGKLFYFSSTTVYSWQSKRVKYCLDHIPGVVLTPYAIPTSGVGPLTLPKTIDLAGYQFLGYVSADGEDVTTTVTKSMTVTPRFKATDIYDYWDQEENASRV